MDEMFTKIFSGIQSDVQKNLEAAEKQTLPGSDQPISLNSSGTINVPFHLDGNGDYHFEKSQYGAGVTVQFKARIIRPDATYTITINSSDGGGGHWENVKAGQILQCSINTSFWHSTKITVDIHANVTNVDGEAVIDYSY